MRVYSVRYDWNKYDTGVCNNENKRPNKSNSLSEAAASILEIIS